MSLYEPAARLYLDALSQPHTERVGNVRVQLRLAQSEGELAWLVYIIGQVSPSVESRMQVLTFRSIACRCSDRISCPTRMRRASSSSMQSSPQLSFVWCRCSTVSVELASPCGRQPALMCAACLFSGGACGGARGPAVVPASALCRPFLPPAISQGVRGRPGKRILQSLCETTGATELTRSPSSAWGLDQ